VSLGYIAVTGTMFDLLARTRRMLRCFADSPVYLPLPVQYVYSVLYRFLQQPPYLTTLQMPVRNRRATSESCISDATDLGRWTGSRDANSTTLLLVHVLAAIVQRRVLKKHVLWCKLRRSSQLYKTMTRSNTQFEEGFCGSRVQTSRPSVYETTQSHLNGVGTNT
jgi:hypothetical protein